MIFVQHLSQKCICKFRDLDYGAQYVTKPVCLKIIYPCKEFINVNCSEIIPSEKYTYNNSEKIIF